MADTKIPPRIVHQSAPTQSWPLTREMADTDIPARVLHQCAPTQSWPLRRDFQEEIDDAPFFTSSTSTAASESSVCWLNYVDAELNFDDGPATMRIWNGRGDDHSLEVDGFTLINMGLPEQYVDWYDPPAAAAALFPLAEQALHTLCPDAKRVIVFDHIARNAARVDKLEKEQLATQGDRSQLVDGNGSALQLLASPGKLVHGDYTVRSGSQRTKELLAPFESTERIDAAMEGRFAIINLWVPLSKVQRDPLAMVEWSTQAPEDVVRVKRIHPHRVGEIYHGVPSKQHRWVYYPSMEPGEALAFKCFDSAEDGRARFVIHSAFTDPCAASEAPARESVELRCMVFFGDAVPAGFAANFIPPHLDPSSPDHDLTPPQMEKSGPFSEW